MPPMVTGYQRHCQTPLTVRELCVKACTLTILTQIIQPDQASELTAMPVTVDAQCALQALLLRHQERLHLTRLKKERLFS